MKTVIKQFSPNLKRPYEKPYEHLQPIVEALIASGNEPLNSSVWVQSRDGWRSDFKRPLDFNLLNELFEFPKSIKLMNESDKIFCQNSWIDIRGNIKSSTGGQNE